MAKVSWEKLRQYRLGYLATPYTKYPEGIETAFELAAKLSGQCLKQGTVIFSPIVHSHPMAIFGEIDPLDYSIWAAYDLVFMQACDHLIVGTLDSWDDSKGVQEEIEFFQNQGRPVFYIDPITFEIQDECPNRK